MASPSAAANRPAPGPLPPRRSRSGRRRRALAARARARRRIAPRPRARRTAWWLAALVPLCAAGVALHAFGLARRDVRAATAAWRHGHYAVAAGDFAAAGKAWPWLPVAAPEQRLQALARSSAAFAQGLAAFRAGAFATAEADLARVLPGDIHYAAARARRATLAAALAAALQRVRVGESLQGFAADSQAFSASYHLAMANLVPAWEQYGFGDPAPYEQAATSPVSRLAPLARRLTADAAAIAAAPACGADPPAGASRALRAAAAQAEAAAAAARRIAQLTTASLQTLEHGGPFAVSADVPKDINGVDGAAATLQMAASGTATALARAQADLGQDVEGLLGRQLPAGLAPPAAAACRRDPHG
jgi:hypothetical protein